MGNIATYQLTNRCDPSQIMHLTRKELIEKFNPDGFFFTTCWPGERSYVSDKDGMYEVYNMTPVPKREYRPKRSDIIRNLNDTGKVELHDESGTLFIEVVS